VQRRGAKRRVNSGLGRGASAMPPMEENAIIKGAGNTVLQWTQFFEHAVCCLWLFVLPFDTSPPRFRKTSKGADTGRALSFTACPAGLIFVGGLVSCNIYNI